MTPRFILSSVLCLSLAGMGVAARADAVTDALQAAMDAYKKGDFTSAAQNITMASQGIGDQQSAMMAALLPPAPDGWTRTDTADFAKGFAMAGGGTGAEATYANADGSVSFKMSFIADNPIVASMGAMLASPAMMAMMGKVVKVGDTALLSQDQSLSTLVANRVLFQAQGAAPDQMLPLVGKVDFAKAGVFDKK